MVNRVPAQSAPLISATNGADVTRENALLKQLDAAGRLWVPVESSGSMRRVGAAEARGLLDKGTSVHVLRITQTSAHISSTSTESAYKLHAIDKTSWGDGATRLTSRTVAGTYSFDIVPKPSYLELVGEGPGLPGAAELSTTSGAIQITRQVAENWTRFNGVASVIYGRQQSEAGERTGLDTIA